MQTAICYVPVLSNATPFFLVSSGHTGKVSPPMTETNLRSIGDGDINATIERAKQQANAWIPVAPFRKRYTFRAYR